MTPAEFTERRLALQDRRIDWPAAHFTGRTFADIERALAIRAALCWGAAGGLLGLAMVWWR